MAQFDANQGPPFVHTVDHMAVIDDVALIEQAAHDGDGLIGLGMNHAGFGADAGPAAFGLDLAMHGIRPRPLDAGAGALRHLEEPVLQNFRADGDRREKRVVAGIAGQGITSERRWQGRSGS